MRLNLPDVIVCPACHAQLNADAMHNELHCSQCGRGYPVVDGIPVLLVERARQERS